MAEDSRREELECIYLFSKLKEKTKEWPVAYETSLEACGFGQGIYLAMMRILYIRHLVSIEGGTYVQSPQQEEVMKKKLDHLEDLDHYQAFYDKAMDKEYFFFKALSPLEEEIYAQYNFDQTRDLGRDLAQYVEFDGKKVLEIGGNSGGLATGIKDYFSCDYTVLDLETPCRLGQAFNEVHDLNLNFIPGDMFKMDLDETYDRFVLVNILHDYDDSACLEVLRACRASGRSGHDWVIIEDLLHEPYGPEAVVMHGLRLAVECPGGRQRLLDDFIDMFAQVGGTLKEARQLNAIHTLLHFTSK